MSDNASLIVSFLGSPIVGAVAGFMFPIKTCLTVPGGNLGGFDYGSSEICSSQFNKGIGAALTLIGWAICAVWFVAALISEHQGSRPPPP